MRLYLTIIVMMAVYCRGYSRNEPAIIIDSATGEPLAKASIFNSKGNVVAFTTDKGIVPELSRSQYPITISYMGYTPLILHKQPSGLIKMMEKVYELPELSVSSKNRNIVHLLGYVREFSTLTTYTDTITLFREKTVDFMVPEKKEKRFKGWLTPRILATKSYYRFSDSYGLDSVSDYFRQHFSWSDWVGIIDRINLPEKVSEDGAVSDTVYGKYSPSSIWRRNGDEVHLDVDFLADTTNYNLVPALSGFLRRKADNPEFTKLTIKYDFSNVGGTSVTAGNIGRISFNIESNGRGKKLFRVFDNNEEYFVSTYAEVYIIEKEYLSIKDAKKWEKKGISGTDLGIYRPPHTPELQAAIKDIIVRVNNQDKNSFRLEQEIDERLVSKHIVNNKPKSLFKKLMGILNH